MTKKDLPDTPHSIMAARIFFNWCIANGLADANPFNHQSVKYGTRSRTLTAKELQAIWHYEHPPFSTILKLLILTGQRRNEISSLTPEQVDDDTITIPAERAKNGREHAFPFGALTAPYLAKLPLRFNGWSKSKARLDREVGVINWTIHDLRRTFATIHAEIGTPIHVVEALLNHKSGTISGVAAIYNHYNYLREMREAVSAYERHLATIVWPAL